MAEGQPTPPDGPRPWYYQNWFLVATFIMGWPIGPPSGLLWPVWSVLILRSPWHSHTLLKGFGWAMLAVGAIMYARMLTDTDGIAGIAVANLIPGLFVTVTTQVMWGRYRLEHGLAERPAASPDSQLERPTSPPRSSRSLRRAHRRRRSPPGRSSGGP